MTDEAAGRIAELTRSQGGATVNLDGTAPDSGFVIAVHGHERVVDNDEHLPDAIKKYAEDNAAELSKSGRHLGTWVNTDDGKVYLDVSEVIDDRLEAVAQMKARGEKAIFDLSHMEEIRSGPLAEFGRITPGDFADDVAAVNPHYGQGREWGTNCQACAVASEYRARGYNVVAKPNTGGIFDSNLEDIKNRFKDKYGTRPWLRPTSIDELDSATEKWPDGARGFVGVTWTATGSAHIFNVAKVDGKTVFYDAQDANEVGPVKPDGWPDRVNWSSGAHLLRVDDLEANDAALKQYLDPGPEDTAAAA